MNFEQARIRMVESQVRTWDVLDPRILSLMSKIPREDFVPNIYHTLAYADMQIPLGHGHVMLPPREIGRILQALQVQAHENVLEIGTGSGYLTVLLAHLAHHVLSIDIQENFVLNAQKQCHQFHLENVHIKLGDAAAAYPADPEERFSVICITGAIPKIEAHWYQHLEIGGRFFAVVGHAPIMQATLITRVDQQEWTHNILYETLVPTLVHAELAPHFEI